MDLDILVKSASRLFTLPEICIKIQDMIYDPTSSAADIAKLIAIDPALSVRLLKIANSSFYNFSSQIDSLGRAVNLIGTEDLYNLALATCTPDAFSEINNSDLIDIRSFWRHSVMTGLISRSLGQSCNIHHSEGLFLAGLFHNLGQLVVLEQVPESCIKIEQSKDDQKAPWEIEKDILGYTYAEIGTALLVHWKMPTNILALVNDQHNPASSDDPRASSLVHISSRTASQLEYCRHTGFDFNRSILPVAWESTGLDNEAVHTAISISEMNCNTMLSAMTGKEIQVA